MTSTAFQCEFCEKPFSNAGNLHRHQKTAKYCLNLRDELLKIIYSCDHCSYSTGLKSDWKRHETTCKYGLYSKEKDDENIRTENLLLKKENTLIKQQNEEYKTQAYKPRTTNLTFNTKQQFYQQYLQPINNVLEILPDEIDKRYTSGHFLKGQEGGAQLIAEILNENEKHYITDSNTGDVFIYKDDKNIVRTDDKARMIIEASKDSLEKTATREYKSKIEEAQELYEDDDITRMSSIKKYRSKLQEIKELPSDSTKFRKKLSHNTFISNQTIKTNQDHPEDIDVGFALLDRLKPKDVSLYLTDSKIQDELNKLSDEEIELFSSVKQIVNYLVDKFLLVDNRLIYKYDQTKDLFVYHEEVQEKMVKKFEKDPTNRFKVTFFHLVKKFLMKKNKPELYRYVLTIDYNLVRTTLSELLMNIE